MLSFPDLTTIRRLYDIPFFAVLFERYLGSKQKLRVAVNDHIGIEPED
jgi:hypothetical protein